MYKQLKDSEYLKFRKDLLKGKGSEQQREFIRITKSNEEFVKFLRDNVAVENGEDVPLISGKLTEGEYKEPPESTEKEMYQAWQEVSPATGCRVAFWGEVTLRHIEKGYINSYYLAANGGSLPGGLERIDELLKDGGSDRDIDGCVRSIFRRMSGLPEARGNISVYINCPFGRAWQRMKWGMEVAGATKKPLKSVLKVFRKKQQYWEELVRLVISRNSVLGDQKIRDVLVGILVDILEEDKRVSEDETDQHKDHPVFISKNLRHLCTLLGTECAWRELGILNNDELEEEIRQKIESVEFVKESSDEN